MDADTCDVHEWMQVHTASAPIRVCPYTHNKKMATTKKTKKNGNLKRGVLGALCYHRLSRHLQEGTNYLQGYFFFDTGHVCGENVSVTQLTI